MLWVKTGFHNLGTTDLLCQIILCWGPGGGGFSGALQYFYQHPWPLYTRFQYQVPPPCAPGIISKNVSRHFQMFPERRNHNSFRITGVKVYVMKNKRQQNFLYIKISDS